MLDRDPPPNSRPPAAADARARRTSVEEALVHLDALYRLAWHLTGNEVDAEGLVHAAFGRALGAAEEAVAISLRARLCRALRDAFVTGAPPADVDGFGGAAPGDLQAALMKLPEEERMVIVLDLEDLSREEMAHVLACAPTMVPARLACARAALRLELAEARDGAL